MAFVQVWSLGRTANQQEENRGHDLERECSAPFWLDDQALPSTETFTYLGSVVRQVGGTKKDIQSRLSKARNAFRSLNEVWRSSQYSIKTKLKLYQICLLSTFLYGSECWQMTEYDLAKLSPFRKKASGKSITSFGQEPSPTVTS